MIHIYGIKNCGTIKKTLDWFEQANVDYTFHDYKKEPATEEKIKDWQEKADWQILINKRGTTWRKLSEETKENTTDAAAARKIMLDNNSIIKRPVIEWDNEIMVGFDPTILDQKLNSHA